MLVIAYSALCKCNEYEANGTRLLRAFAASSEMLAAQLLSSSYARDQSVLSSCVAR